MVKTQKSFNFTKKDIDALPIPEKGFVTYSDTKEKGLKLYVTHTGAKTFFIRKFVGNKDERLIIGPYPDLTISQARDKALELKNSIAQGNNPAEEKYKLRNDVTLNEFFNHYMNNHSKPNKRPNSIKAEISIYNNNVRDFIGYKKMTLITKSDIESIVKRLNSAGMTTLANRVISLLSGMYNRAIEWGYPEENPVKCIKKNKEKSRERFLQPEEFPNFFNALDMIGNLHPVFKNYILMSIYTGQRRNNVLSMKWSQINFLLKIWFIPMTKNGDSFNCPLADKAIELLEEMKKSQTSDWVFPSELSASGHYEEPKRLWHQLLKMAGIEDLRLHDLRRTFGSYQVINGSSLPITGKSLGHRSAQSTQVYARLITDPVRNSSNGALALMDSYIKNNGNI